MAPWPIPSAKRITRAPTSGNTWPQCLHRAALFWAQGHGVGGAGGGCWVLAIHPLTQHTQAHTQAHRHRLGLSNPLFGVMWFRLNMPQTCWQQGREERVEQCKPAALMLGSLITPGHSHPPAPPRRCRMQMLDADLSAAKRKAAKPQIQNKKLLSDIAIGAFRENSPPPPQHWEVPASEHRSGLQEIRR